LRNDNGAVMVKKRVHIFEANEGKREDDYGRVAELKTRETEWV